MLPARFREPAGFQWGSFISAKGARIRYGFLQAHGTARGTVVLVPGFREPIEKEFEIVRDMTERGFAVWVIDRRGQGGSDRFIPDHPQRMHSGEYEEHVETLHQFADKVVQKAGLTVLMGHSMGAHISLRYLKERTGIFDCAVLTSPMFEILTPGFPKPLARKLAQFACAMGWLEKYAATAHDWNPEDEAFAGNNKTSDPVRFGVTKEIFEKTPAVVMGGPTYGWVYRTFNSMDILNDPEYLKAIKTPLLMGIAGNDTIVDKAAAERACQFLPHCIRVDVPVAQHEIWMEKDEIRTNWLARVTAFLEERLKSPS